MNSKDKTENISTELLQKYFNHKCDDSEKEIVHGWYNDIKSEKTLKSKLRDQWGETALEPTGCEVDSNRIFNKICRNIHTIEREKEHNKPLYQKFYNTFSKIAAIIILPVLIFSGWYFVKSGIISNNEENISYAEIFSPLGARSHFELPDGSTGWLNSGSTLKFPVKFRGQVRKVSLSGEGYFDVVKNSKKPFVVKTGDIEVMALGTKFNVLTYPDDKTTNITLESGKVVINAICKNKKVVRITELEPDQQTIIKNESMKFQKRKVDSKNYTSWKQGILKFRNEPMNEVIERLERWYNVEIVLMDKELENYKYRATFEDETLNEVLSLIKLTSPVDFKQDKRVKLPDGSFTKKKIRMFIKPDYKDKIN